MTNEQLTYLVSLDIDELSIEALLQLAKMLGIRLDCLELDPDYIVREIKESIDFYRVFWM